MRKNNWWNRIFHKVELRINQDDATLQTSLYARKDEVLKNLAQCTTLGEVLDFHKQIWKDGYRNRNIGPYSYGIFHTDNIENMKPKEVYLGGIWGLLTKPIPFWEEHKSDKYGANGYGIDPEKSLYEMILNQYKSHLRSNIIEITNNALNLINKFIEAGYECYYQRR